MTLAQFIVDYVRKHRSVTFGEVQEAGRDAGYTMHGRLELACGKALVWSCMSPEFAVAVHNLVSSRQVRIVRTTRLDCLVSSPRILISEQPWIPCRLEAS